MKGKLIVFEGIDGSGKSTQFEKMCARLESEGAHFKRLVFPRYKEDSSALIRMYLNGAFGENPRDVSPYAASTFYAVDRYASYVQEWRDYYQEGGLVLADRYATSNAIHQASKLPADKREEFFKWLWDFEYRLLELPPPDTVIYMDIPLETVIERIRRRGELDKNSGDIHEADYDYLSKCHECGKQAAGFYGWETVSMAVCDSKMGEIEAIHEEIYGIIKKMT